MINYPIVQHLKVSGYGLFGSAPTYELSAGFPPGVTLILGANGLGKTTLVSMLFRLLTGPSDVTALQYRQDLGTARLDASRISNDARAMFGRRVSDGARNATATLRLRLGESVVEVNRNLSDLRLLSLRINDSESGTSEEVFQKEIVRLVGVRTFGDWVLVLRYLTFYFEDRRALVWDSTAQRQILRVLFLPQDIAAKWTLDEREILDLDSRMRNLRAVISREERTLATTQVKSASGATVAEELKSLAELQRIDQEQRDQLDAELLTADISREEARLRVLKAEDDREGHYREVERIKLESIAASFPDRTETARYVLAQLLAEATCLVCGSLVPEVARDLDARVTNGRCVVCDSRTASRRPGPEPAAIATAISDLEISDANLAESRLALAEAETNHSGLAQRITQLNAAIHTHSSRIDWLVRQLPPAEAVLHEQRSQLAVLRGLVEELKVELTAKKDLFRTFMDNVNQSIVGSATAIKKNFDGFADGFLLDQCKLVWSPKKSQVGQEGGTVDFPAFELEMSGNDFVSPVRRSGPEQVSESQREFIDLSFRMALMSVSGSDAQATLVIDTPEASLDAVFASRAAEVLQKFASKHKNRVVVTSNLIEGALIPGLVNRQKPTPKRSAVIDLFKIAAPTAAVRKLGGEYDALKAKLIGND